jgi:hypothetical protein
MSLPSPEDQVQFLLNIQRLCVQSISDGSFIVRSTSASWSSGYSFQYWNVEEKAWEPSANGEISTYFNDGRLFNSSALYVKIVCPFGDQRFRK